MPVSYSDFLSSARDSAESSESSEMALRNAGSRAYYALYHRTCERLAEIGLDVVQTEHAGSHKSLIDTIKLAGPKGKSFAYTMEGLKRFRNNCDYDLDMIIRPGRVAKHISEIMRLLSMLERMGVEDPSPTVSAR